MHSNANSNSTASNCDDISVDLAIARSNIYCILHCIVQAENTQRFTQNMANLVLNSSAFAGPEVNNHWYKQSSGTFGTNIIVYDGPVLVMYTTLTRV